MSYNPNLIDHNPSLLSLHSAVCPLHIIPLTVYKTRQGKCSFIFPALFSFTEPFS